MKSVIMGAAVKLRIAVSDRHAPIYLHNDVCIVQEEVSLFVSIAFRCQNILSFSLGNFFVYCRE